MLDQTMPVRSPAKAVWNWLRLLARRAGDVGLAASVAVGVEGAEADDAAPDEDRGPAETAPVQPWCGVGDEARDLRARGRAVGATRRKLEHPGFA